MYKSYYGKLGFLWICTTLLLIPPMGGGIELKLFNLTKRSNGTIAQMLSNFAKLPQWASSVVMNSSLFDSNLHECYDDVIGTDSQGQPIRINLFEDSPLKIAKTVLQVFANQVSRLRSIVRNVVRDAVKLPGQVIRSIITKENKMELTVLRSIDDLRRIVSNCIFADKDNRGRYGWTPLALMDESEFSKLLGLRTSNSTNRRRRSPECFIPPKESITNLPEVFDWRQQGVVTSVQTQSCADCTVFSTLAAVESALLIAFTSANQRSRASELDLSEQMLDVCIDGCMGGMFDEPYQWMVKHGAVHEDDAPYDSDNNETQCTGPFPYSISNYCHWQRDDANPLTDMELQWLLLHYGPVSVGLDASSADIRFVRGRYTATGACHNGFSIDHAVLLVGWTRTDWIIKNSWGVDWGDRGFFTMPRRRNLCGINTIAYVPIV